ncbi:hypothetical protein [Flavobacterium haoranii]|uniref:YD repeat-containing protein n=1 Tax=Flavobacterium haoranii TaxID=683124 RepID=A0A1M6CWD4_9FLAO|nr:hypothetical protein [Flavobacterium haoranii]SHI65306.1 hypothetical protein SAMN05444337_0485 [Flavobacterium haoranii]
MKKVLLILALMLSVVSFANNSEAKTEIAEVVSYTLEVRNNKGTVLHTRQFSTEKDLLTYCYDSVMMYYMYSYTDFETGQSMDMYQVVTTRRCITV